MKTTFTSTACGLLLLAMVSSGCVRFSIYLPDSAFEAVKPEEKPAEPKSPARDLTNAMTEELKLEPGQQGRIHEILHTTLQKARAARTLYADNPMAMNTALRRINADSERQLRAALSLAQYQQYMSGRQKLQARMQAKASPMPAAPITQ
ncbi:hypothetical protein [Hymenobacter sp. DG25A]|uniref:hypothetical protein n=1 Tax=Hymenobacter sp. DG25A TaxID=1385663 RepID=UPI000AA5A8B9|nr:hypothetical protein [Hymenobacter sp. DG25A]